MIVVEGPDGVGKTTLVNELCRELGLQRKKWVDDLQDRDVYLPRDPRGRTYMALSQAVAGETVYVHDRLFWSEAIYGSILRGGSKFTVLEEFRIMNLFRAMRCPVIFVRRPWKDCLDEIRENPPQLEGWDEDKAFAIWDKYNEAIESAVGHGLNVLTYDWNDRNYFTRSAVCTSVDTVKHHIEQYLNDRKEWTV